MRTGWEVLRTVCGPDEASDGSVPPDALSCRSSLDRGPGSESDRIGSLSTESAAR